MKAVRSAVNAGHFYPADASELRRMIEDYFDKAAVEPEIDRPKGLVSPHAGYVFSGQTAAWAYKQIMDRGYRRAVVIAPSHYAAFSGASIFAGSAYETPLGQIAMDLEFIEKLKAENKVFAYRTEAHSQEHSLEVQLPFLQLVLKEFQLVPIVIYDQGLENCRRIAKALVSVIKADEKQEKTILVASSDLYHGGSYQQCKDQDQRLAHALEAFSPEEFQHGIDRGRFMACGYGPITTVMLAARDLGAGKSKVVYRTNSYDANPISDDYVVGYLAAVFY